MRSVTTAHSSSGCPGTGKVPKKRRRLVLFGVARRQIKLSSDKFHSRRPANRTRPNGSKRFGPSKWPSSLPPPTQHTLSLGYPREMFSSEVHPWDYPRTMCTVWATVQWLAKKIRWLTERWTARPLWQCSCRSGQRKAGRCKKGNSLPVGRWTVKRTAAVISRTEMRIWFRLLAWRKREETGRSWTWEAFLFGDRKLAASRLVLRSVGPSYSPVEKRPTTGWKIVLWKSTYFFPSTCVTVVRFSSGSSPTHDVFLYFIFGPMTFFCD